MLGRGTATGLEGHKVGDYIRHYTDSSLFGTIVSVEENALSVMVRWDDYGPDEEPDFQWANKVVKATT